jgi:hypothetical protein
MSPRRLWGFVLGAVAKAKEALLLKKKQKLLLLVPRTNDAEYAVWLGLWQKFFGSFFKKEHLAFTYRCTAPCSGSANFGLSITWPAIQ